MMNFKILMFDLNVISFQLILRKLVTSFLNPDRRNLTPTFISPLEVNPYNDLIDLNSLGSMLTIISPGNIISAMYVKKIAKSIGIIFKSHFFLSSKTKLTRYYTLTYPHIVYCNSAWSSTYVSNLNIIYDLQKGVVRAITNSDYRAHSAPLFSKLGIFRHFTSQYV